jgi:peptide-methionine (R)-S-oxide reductase
VQFRIVVLGLLAPAFLWAAEPTQPQPQGENKVEKSEQEWEKVLTPSQFNVLRQKGTEPPFKNAYWDNHEKGTYQCAACAEELFRSEEKFESGTGWPSFWKPMKTDGVAEKSDKDFGMTRTEALCRRCGSHLGHIFPDGPEPTGLRYCINSTSLKFVKEEGK